MGVMIGDERARTVGCMGAASGLRGIVGKENGRGYVGCVMHEDIHG